MNQPEIEIIGIRGTEVTIFGYFQSGDHTLYYKEVLVLLHKQEGYHKDNTLVQCSPNIK